MQNNLQKQLNCAFCEGKAITYYYKCNKCGEEFTTNESTEQTINNFRNESE